MHKNYLFIILGILLAANVLAISTISSPSVCCEQTNDGGACMNVLASSSCDSSLRIVPTSCEATSFCKLGTCYESKEGLCLENVPQKVCQSNGGTWSEKSINELPVCQLGCCIISDQAAFVTLTRCKSLSSFYGIKTDYRPQITSELACVETANSQDEGACVFYESTVKTCKFTTRKECGGSTSTITLNASALEDQSGKRFYKDVLCSAEELQTECARQIKTGCYGEKVYWYDSCGNRENVYFSDGEKSWNKGRVADPDAICAETGDSKTCGNCDYLLGSRCSSWESLLGIGKPKNVDQFCKTTKCTDRDGKTRMNGESWCVYDGEVGNGRDTAGSRHYREICSDGKVVVEACEDFRNQICIHSGLSSSAGEYSVAACRVNRWQDCTSQTKKDTCENTDARDCIWVAAVDGVNFTKETADGSTNSFSNPTTTPFSNPISPTAPTKPSVADSATKVADVVKPFTLIFPLLPLTGNAVKHIVGSGVGQWEENELNNKLRTNRTDNETGLCVPSVSPGQEFWTQGDSQGICGQATANCEVNITRTYKKDLLTGKKELDKVVVSENDCLKIIDKKKATFEVNRDWAARVNAICSALGDCGADVNFNGVFTDDGYEWKYKNESYFFTQSDLGLLTSPKLGKGTGEAIAIDYIINDKYKLGQDDYVYIKQ